MPTPHARAQNFLSAHLNTVAAERKIDTIRPGYLVCVHTKIRDGAKERIQKFEGRCIGIRGSGLDSTYKVFAVAQDIGMCKTFPLYAYDVQLVRKGRSRRAKMNYFKALRGKRAKIRDIR